MLFLLLQGSRQVTSEW